MTHARDDLTGPRTASIRVGKLSLTVVCVEPARASSIAEISGFSFPLDLQLCSERAQRPLQVATGQAPRTFHEA